MGVMHAGRIETNKTLQRLFAFLREHSVTGATGLEICEALKIMNAATWVSQLRKNGYGVECEYERTTESGAKVYRYRLSQ